MVLDNFVTLEEGRGRRLHFTDHQLVTGEMPDPLLGIAKMVTRLVFVVDEEDGAPVAKTLSIPSSKLASQFTPYLADKSYRRFVYTVTRRGAGFLTDYQVDARVR